MNTTLIILTAIVSISGIFLAIQTFKNTSNMKDSYKASGAEANLSAKLDALLEETGVDPELFESLGNSIRGKVDLKQVDSNETNTKINSRESHSVNLSRVITTIDEYSQYMNHLYELQLKAFENKTEEEKIALQNELEQRKIELAEEMAQLSVKLSRLKKDDIRKIKKNS